MAQLPTIKWDYDLSAPAFGSSAAADMDGDGYYEIVFATYTNDGRAHCLNAEDGSVKWIYDIGGCGDVAPLITDVDSDGQLDVLINGSCNPTIFCINGSNGALKWSKASGGGDSPPTTADIDGDGKPEVLFCNFSGELRILNGEDGSLNRMYQIDTFGYAVQTEPTLVDCNGDGNLDIIVADYFNTNGLHVWAIDYAADSILWTNTMLDTSDFNAYHGGAVADLDGNGDKEYVVGTNNGKVRALNVEDGTVLWSVDIQKSNFASIAVADLDANGDLEVIVTNNDWISFDERIWVLDGLDGSEEWSYPTNYSSFRGCAIGDINGNDTLDLVAGFFMGELIAVEPYTGLLWTIDLQDEFSETFPYFLVDHGALIADFDKNGKMDVFTVAGYGTYIPDSLNTGRAFMLEAGDGDCPEWLMFRQDAERSGYLSEEDIHLACDPLGYTDTDAKLIQWTVQPNPASDMVQFFSDSKRTIQIRNVLGKIVTSLDLSAGITELDVRDWTAGLYFLESRNESGRLLIQH